MQLHILGSGTALALGERNASGYGLVASDSSACVLECGPGSTRRWPQAGIDPERLRVLLCTHHHPDHCGELPAVLFARNVYEPPLRTPLCLAGPVGHSEHLAGLERLFGAWVADRQDSLQTVELSDGAALSVPPFEIECREVRHHPGSLGVRVRADGSVLAFSGDSGPCRALVELCRGADLALLECSYPASRPTDAHLCSADVARIATEAGVQRLVLTHFYPEAEATELEREVREAGYRGWLALARDGDVFDL